jgi:hypothetical protein
VTARTTMLRATAPKANRTVRTREDSAVGRSFAEREIMRRFGQPPHSEFDEIANGGEVGIVRHPER